MTDLVDTYKIEQIVGVPRHAHKHYGRAVSDEKTFYILHSGYCKENAVDLRVCGYSRALDNGLDMNHWAGYEDKPVVLVIQFGRLVPAPSIKGWVGVNG